MGRAFDLNLNAYFLKKRFQSHLYSIAFVKKITSQCSQNSINIAECGSVDFNS